VLFTSLSLDDRGSALARPGNEVRNAHGVTESSSLAAKCRQGIRSTF
jgi:hypothetical protein